MAKWPGGPLPSSAVRPTLLQPRLRLAAAVARGAAARTAAAVLLLLLLLWCKSLAKKRRW